MTMNLENKIQDVANKIKGGRYSNDDLMNLCAFVEKRSHFNSSKPRISAANEAKKEYDIYIVGLGITNFYHLTPETEEILYSVQEVLHITGSRAMTHFLEAKCKSTFDLSNFYETGKDRSKTYYQMASKVLQSALTKAPICFALYGHPIVYAYPPFLIYEAAEALGLKTKIVTGISAMDCLFTDLIIDPATNGMQMYGATDLLLKKRPLQTDASVLLWQIGVVESSLYSTATNNPERFTNIKNYLLKFYPSDHEVYCVFSSPDPNINSRVITFKIGEIESVAGELHAGDTMYIPPLKLRKIKDKEMYGRLTDSSLLGKFTV